MTRRAVILFWQLLILASLLVIWQWGFEWSKALLPSMDADAIGGAVNLITRKAPAASIFSLEAAGGLAPIRRRPPSR